VAVILAAAALGLTSLRALLTYRENIRMLRTSAREAVTDGLTGLGNRRRLMLDLDAALAQCAEHPLTLAFFDLNGFKRYNDSFGHAAGDQLLSRLGAALRLAAGAHGHAYRLGGDEFCLLLEGRFTREDPVLARATAALGEGGAGFSVSAAVGVAVAPDDGGSATTILQLADQRMYFDKVRLTHRTRSATHQVLMTVLDERTPWLHTHVHGVGQLALAIGREFGLQNDALRELHRAAELHDVGKLAIPDQILEKPGPLDEDEWAFIHQHTTIGQRILDADPTLRAVGRLVRASHERWDGNGYPDGLAADQIPLAARIIAACDAYEAITATRCYQPARSLEQAVAELQRHAGTQFDPTVVEVLCRIVTQKRIPGSAGDAHVVAPEPWGRAQVA
jgi:two-component system cell cycle response regulator